VAAPVSSEWFSSWSHECFTNLQLVLDLRGECDRDPIVGNAQVIGLADFFAAIEANRKQMDLAIQAAQRRIKELLIQIHQSVRNRPFGWDDICA
jgi:hypothetical protein